MQATTEARFWCKVNKSGPTVHAELGPCWLWTGSTKNGRYGNFWFINKNELAHRVAWFIETGKWPDPNALHRCDVTLCVRFTHLFEGNTKDNVADREAKRRNKAPIGECNGHAKLTVKKVRRIRAKFAEGEPYVSLAKVYKVTCGHISAIVRRLKWKHVT
jgi:uncharacterized protein YeaC (DUF1315 family)